MTDRGKAGVVIAVIVVIGLIVNAASKKDSSTAATSTGQAQLALVRSSSYCMEVPSEARIWTSITIRNTGDAAGTVDPWAAYEYSDGGHSSETYLSGSETGESSLTVPAYSTRVARFVHSYNPQQHLLLRCIGSTDLDDSTAPSYYLKIDQG